MSGLGSAGRACEPALDLVFNFKSSSPPKTTGFPESVYFAFTSRARRLGHAALPPLDLWGAGLRGLGGRGGVWAVDLRGHAFSRLRAFLKATCFVLLHAGTPLAPLAQNALVSTLTWAG